MFIFTAKFNRKKAIAIVIALAVFLCALIIIVGQIKKSNSTAEAAVLSAAAKNNGQRVKFLNALGWEVDENAIEEQEVIIPRKFTDVYDEYNRIQLAQGFDLTKHAGVEATRYTYRVLNYPGVPDTLDSETAKVVADIVVFRGEVIAGNIQSCTQNGFMTGLEYPKTA